MTQFRPRRSVLYLPAANARAIAKAQTLDADCIILDLEDAVAPDAKPAAREAAAEAVRSGTWGHREVTIRMNGLDTVWANEDYRAAVAAGASAIVAPKIGSAAEARAAAERAEGLPLWVMIETPRGIQEVDRIADVEGVAALVVGTSDLGKELNASVGRGRTEIAYALQRVLIAARASGKIALDGVFVDIDDPQGFEAECLDGQRMGFDGKTVIHPAQVEIANRVFAPSHADIDYARRVIAAHEAARAEGRGVTTLGTKMVEALHVEQAQRILDIAVAIEARGG
jgi:citrate lyase subunit beta/citryl-CoA lyase